MDAPFHAHPHTARFLPSVRTLALLTFGIGIGIVAALPLGGHTAIAAVVAIVAATAAAAVVLLRPDNPAAIGVADVLLGLAVIATVFGRLGLLYLPLLLAFLAVTARIERAPERSDAGLHWEPAPEFEDTLAPSIAAPATTGNPDPVALGEPGILAEPDAPESEPTAAGSVMIRVTAPPQDDVLAEPDVAPDLVMLDDLDDLIADTAAERDDAGGWDPADAEDAAALRHSGRHRAPSHVRRAASAAARAGRRLGHQAVAGVGNIRTAITTEPTGTEPPDPAAEDDDATPEGAPMAPAAERDRRTELDALRHEFEERELELVAAAKPWSSLTHRAYGELRFLPPPPTPPRPPRRRPDSDEVERADWETPSWKSIGDP